MPITTLDGHVAGLRPLFDFSKSLTPGLAAGRPQSLWALAGAPGPGSYDTTLNGVTLSSSSAIPAGAIPHFDPSGSAFSYLAYFEAQATQAGRLLLRDRLWHNGGISVTITTAQTITSPTWPARMPTSGTDDTPSTNGLGVRLSLEVSAITGSGAPLITVGYTNQDGVAGRTATNILATVATVGAGVVYDIGLQAGDTGVRSVQSITFSSSWTSGTVHLVAWRPIAALSLLAQISNAIDPLTGAGTRLYNGVVPWLVFVPNTTTNVNVQGSYRESQG